MDEQSEFDKFIDGVAKHLKENCSGTGVMILVHVPGTMHGIEMWVNTPDPLFGAGILRLATLAVEDSVRARSISQLQTSSVSKLFEAADKEKQRMN